MENAQDKPKIKATTEWMSSMYNKMNQELFNGELGPCKFAIFTTGNGSQGRVLGWFGLTCKNLACDKRMGRRIFSDGHSTGRVYVNSENFVEICKPQIELNGNYRGTEDSLLATLVHEMCHYYTFMRGFCPSRPHGKEFYSIGEVVSARSNGRFTIQRIASAEEMRGYELDAKIKDRNEKRLATRKSKVYAVFVFNQNGSIELTTTSNQEIIEQIAKLAAMRDNRDIRSKALEVIVSKDPRLIELLFTNGYDSNMRTYQYYSVENEPWSDIIKEYDHKVLYKAKNMYSESKKVEKIVEETINRFLINEFGENGIDNNDNIVPIDPNMNLGIESPFDI